MQALSVDRWYFLVAFVKEFEPRDLTESKISRLLPTDKKSSFFSFAFIWYVRIWNKNKQHFRNGIFAIFSFVHCLEFVRCFYDGFNCIVGSQEAQKGGFFRLQSRNNL